MQGFFKFISDAWSAGVDVKPEWLYTYKSNYLRAKRAHKELEEWVDARPSRANDSIPGPDEFDWAQFAELIKIEKSGSTHTLQRRLRVLEGLQCIFRMASSYEGLDVDDRKRIAGTMGEAEARKKDGVDYDWAWFGAMTSNGSFSTTVINDPGGFRAPSITSRKRGQCIEITTTP